MKKLYAAFALVTALMLLAGCVTPTPAATPAPTGEPTTAPAAAATATPETTAAPAPNSVEAIKTRGELIVATNAEFQPFEYMEGDKIVGVDMEIAQAIADKLGVKLTITNMSFDGVLIAVPSGKADLGIAGMSKKPERVEVMDFSDIYFVSSVVMLVAKDNDTIKTIDDLKGKRLGVQLGTAADTMVASGITDANVRRLNKDADSVQDLINGKLDAVLLDKSPAQVFANQLSDKIKLIDEPLSDEQYAVAANKGNTSLIDVVNEVIKELKASGQYDAILAKYNVKQQ